MATTGQLEFVTIDIEALEYNVIPHFQLILGTLITLKMIFLRFKGIQMATNIQHKNHHFLTCDYF